MQNIFSTHTRAVLQALLVTFLWSTSFVLVKIGLADIPALTFAGLRYTIAFAVLVPFALRKRQLHQLKSLPRTMWLRLILLGILFYSVTQGSNFWALVYLPAATTSLLFNFTPVIVAILSALFLHEPTKPNQMVGVIVFLFGTFVYFYPLKIPFGEILGLAIAVVGVLANGVSSVLGRHINRDSGLDPLVVTVISMGVGAFILLLVGLTVQGLPKLGWKHWGIILWLAVVNSAFAFTLWNQTLRSLSATESSVINNTMLIQIALLAWIFLEERLDTTELVGLGLATVGVMIVQFSRPNAVTKQNSKLAGTENRTPDSI
jgi:drug/metabolite transporter (DMT)-like permease